MRSHTRGVTQALRIGWQAGNRTVVSLICVVLCSGLLPIAVVSLTGQLVGSLAVGASESNQAAYAFGLVICLSTSQLLPYLSTYFYAKLRRSSTTIVQARLFDLIDRRLNYQDLELPEVRDKLYMAAQSAEESPSAIVRTTLSIGQSLVTLVGISLTLLHISSLVVIFVLLASMPVVLIEYRIGRARSKAALEITPMERRKWFFADLQTDLVAVKEVKLLGLGQYFQTRMLRELTTLQSTVARIDSAEVRLQLLAGLIGAAALGAAVAAALSATTSPGALASVLAALTLTGLTTVGMFRELIHGRFALVALEQYLDLESTNPEHQYSGIPARCLSKRIEFRDIWFRYPGNVKWTLRGISFSLDVGSSSAVVGPNGAGKSTIIKLLGRLYEPTRGQILWDGVDISTIDRISYQKRLSCMFQDFYRYDMTVRENVELGDIERIGKKFGLDELMSAVGLTAAISQMPNDVDTLLGREFADEGQSHVTLSGGQWQRLAVARGLFRQDADIVLFDEPTASLDPTEELRLMKMLLGRSEVATCVIVSHRMSHARMCKQIVVIDDGVCLEVGSHDNLVQRPGLYSSMFAAQAAGFL